jgi:hypothetical protein
MGRVHTSDRFVAIEIAYESAWGTVATTGFERISPVTDPGETLSTNRGTLSVPNEYSSPAGARTSYDYGRGFVKGEITLLPSYNSRAFAILLRELNGGNEGLGGGFRGPSGSIPTGSPSRYSTHVFFPASFQATTPVGNEGGVSRPLTIRVWKSGPDQTGTIDRWVSSLVTGMKWEQPTDSRPKVTFRFIGKQLSTLAATGLAPYAIQGFRVVNGGSGTDTAVNFDGTSAGNLLNFSTRAGNVYTLTRDVQATTLAIQTGNRIVLNGFYLNYSVSYTPNLGVVDDNGALVPIRLQDLKNRTSQPVCPGIFQTGASLANNAEIRAFNIDFESHVDIDPAFITSPDALLKPAHLDRWECTGDLTLAVEQDYYGSTKPHFEFNAKTLSQLRLRYVSDTNAFTGGSDGASMPFCFDLWLNSVRWKSSRPNLSAVGNPPHPVEFEALNGSYAAASYAWGASPSAQTGQWMIQTVSDMLDAVNTGAVAATPPTDILVPPQVQTAFVPPAAKDTSNWTGGANVETDDADFAYTTTINTVETYSDFSWLLDDPVAGIFSDGVLETIEVRLDSRKGASAVGSGTYTISAAISLDAGSTWSAYQESAALTVDETPISLSGTTTGWDLWGLGGALGADLSDLKIRMKSTGSGTLTSPRWEVEFAAVRVTWHAGP